MSDMLDRLNTMKKWAQLLMTSANNDIAEKRINKALEKYIAVLQMGKHQYQQPSMIDFLFGAGIEALSTNQLKRFVVMGDATEKRLNLIEQALFEVKHDWSYDLPRIIDHEKLFTKNFWGMFYGVNPEGKIRLNPGVATKVIIPQLPEDIKNKFVITYWHERLMKAWTILWWFYMPATPQKVGEIIDSEYKRFYAMTKPDFDWRKRPREFSIASIRFNYRYMIEMQLRILESTYYSIHDTYLRIISQQSGALLTIASRRYKNKNGHWPESLDQVKSLTTEEIFVDPINNSSFIYKLTDGNFVLYSRGKNDIDENGKYKDGADDWPIWPPVGKWAARAKF
jgi:hypothetical protein